MLVIQCYTYIQSFRCDRILRLDPTFLDTCTCVGIKLGKYWKYSSYFIFIFYILRIEKKLQACVTLKIILFHSPLFFYIIRAKCSTTEKVRKYVLGSLRKTLPEGTPPIGLDPTSRQLTLNLQRQQLKK